MAFFDTFSVALKQKWLEYYQANRSWLILHMTVHNTVATPDGGRRPASYLILGILVALEPELQQLMLPLSMLKADADSLLEVLGLNFDPDLALGLESTVTPAVSTPAPSVAAPVVSTPAPSVAPSIQVAETKTEPVSAKSSDVASVATPTVEEKTESESKKSGNIGGMVAAGVAGAALGVAGIAAATALLGKSEQQEEEEESDLGDLGLDEEEESASDLILCNCQ